MAQVSELEDKPVQVLLEQVLGCGIGACYGCRIETKKGPKLVCKDGPVFELSDIIWEEIKEPVSREA
jgi:dihydroorotate dehydrogenase electron transfer subunit